MEKSYSKWLKDVDRELLAVSGLSHDDLPDFDYRSLYDQGLYPDEVACIVIDENYWEESY